MERVWQSKKYFLSDAGLTWLILYQLPSLCPILYYFLWPSFFFSSQFFQVPKKLIFQMLTVTENSKLTLCSNFFHMISMILLSYYYTLQQNHAFLTSLCIQLHFSQERGKYHCDESALPVTRKERGEKGKSASDLRWKTDTHIVVHGFAAKFSNKKAEYYYMHYYITVTVNSKLTIFKFILHALPHNRMAFIPPPPSTHKVYHA